MFSWNLLFIYLCQKFDRLLNVIHPDEVVLIKIVDLEGVVQLCLTRCSLAQGGEEKEEFVETFQTFEFLTSIYAWLNMKLQINGSVVWNGDTKSKA